MSLINLNQLNIIDSIAVTPNGSVPIAIQFGDNIWSGNYAEGMLVPKGDTSERIPIVADGYIRYNTDLSEFDTYTNAGWRPIGQLTQDGETTIPSRSFISDTTTGSYLSAPGVYSITAGGVTRFNVDSIAAYVVDELTVTAEVSDGDAEINILSGNNKIGTILWTDTTTSAFIRYNHLIERFEFSGFNSDVAMNIDGTSNEINIFEPLNFSGTPSENGIFKALGGFNFVLDNDNNETTSVFKIQKHSSIDTGFEINQDGAVQLVNGLVSAPSLTFVNSTDSGIYSPSAGTVAIVSGGVSKVEIDTTNTTVKNKLVTEGNITVGSAVGDMEVVSTQTETLLASQVDTPLPAPLTYSGSTIGAVIVDYSINRDVGQTIGTMYIVNDGTSVNFSDTTQAVLGATGITFTATIGATIVQVKYTSTAGTSATMKYVIRRWDI